MVILTERKFGFGWYMLCKHYPGFPIWIRLVVMEGHFGQNGQKLHKIKKSSSGGTWGERQTNFEGSGGGSAPPLPPISENPAFPKWNHPKGNICACSYFIKTKTVDSKDQNKNEFHIIPPAIKTNASRISFTVKQNFISRLM